MQGNGIKTAVVTTHPCVVMYRVRVVIPKMNCNTDHHNVQYIFSWYPQQHINWYKEIPAIISDLTYAVGYILHLGTCMYNNTYCSVTYAYHDSLVQYIEYVTWHIHIIQLCFTILIVPGGFMWILTHKLHGLLTGTCELLLDIKGSSIFLSSRRGRWFQKGYAWWVYTICISTII